MRRQRQITEVQSKRSARSIAVLIRRYVGLVMAGFLLLAGLTGAIIVWNDELDAAINPTLFHASVPTPGATMLDVFTLRERALAQLPNVEIDYVRLEQAPGENAIFGVAGAIDPATNEHRSLDFDEIFINPYTGDVVGRRTWGDISEGVTNLIPFIYTFHYTLALDIVGTYLFGIIGLLWTIDCFVGAWLTFPRRSSKHPTRPTSTRWFSRWAPAWRVRWGASAPKLNFDLHVAGSLWPWAMLFVFAWSSVAFNLDEVYRPAMASFFEFQTYPERSVNPDDTSAPMSWPAAIARGHELAAELAAKRGVTLGAPYDIYYDHDGHLFSYGVRSDLDISADYNSIEVIFDATTGAYFGEYLSVGGAAGDTVTEWLLSLHMAAVWGLPYRIFVTLLGILVAVVSTTGVLIWWRKRRARTSASARRSRKSPLPAPASESGSRS
ncbi:MAG: PepSY-associated TM helix domain-containing protein [Pseudomonadota bacterium]